MVEEESTREQIEDIINNEEPVKEETDKEIKEETPKLQSKPKSKAKAKSKIKITKEPVQPIEEETTIE